MTIKRGEMMKAFDPPDVKFNVGDLLKQNDQGEWVRIEPGECAEVIWDGTSVIWLHPGRR